MEHGGDFLEMVLNFCGVRKTSCRPGVERTLELKGAFRKNLSASPWRGSIAMWTHVDHHQRELSDEQPRGTKTLGAPSRQKFAEAAELQPVHALCLSPGIEPRPRAPGAATMSEVDALTHLDAQAVANRQQHHPICRARPS